MHARWMMSVVLTAGLLSFGHVFAEETAEPVTPTPAPAAPAHSIRGEADAVESRVVGSPPTILSSSWWGAVEQAERWKLAGDVAMLNRQPVVAYPFYDKVAKTFPGTPHGKVAAFRGNNALYHLRHTGNYPPEEDILREIYDLLTW